MKETLIKVCEICGKEYLTTCKAQKYCSEECAAAGALQKQREYRARYPEKIRRQNLESYYRNREKRRVYMKAYVQKNREKRRVYMQDYMQKNAERIKEYRREYNLTHREEIREKYLRKKSEKEGGAITWQP